MEFRCTEEVFGRPSTTPVGTLLLFAGTVLSVARSWLKLLDTAMFFCFDTLCQLAYMIYITNAKAKINILSITAGAGNIGYLLLTTHRRYECYNAAPAPSRLGGAEFGQLLRKIIKNVPTRCQI